MSTKRQELPGKGLVWIRNVSVELIQAVESLAQTISAKFVGTSKQSFHERPSNAKRMGPSRNLAMIDLRNRQRIIREAGGECVGHRVPSVQMVAQFKFNCSIDRPVGQRTVDSTGVIE